MLKKSKDSLTGCASLKCTSICTDASKTYCPSCYQLGETDLYHKRWLLVKVIPYDVCNKFIEKPRYNYMIIILFILSSETIFDHNCNCTIGHCIPKPCQENTEISPEKCKSVVRCKLLSNFRIPKTCLWNFILFLGIERWKRCLWMRNIYPRRESILQWI